MHHHALTVDVAGFQVGQLRAPGAGRVEAHEQDARARSARRMDELRDFSPAKNRRQAMCLFRIGSIGHLARGHHEHAMHHAGEAAKAHIEDHGQASAAKA